MWHKKMVSVKLVNNDDKTWSWSRSSCKTLFQKSDYWLVVCGRLIFKLLLMLLLEHRHRARVKIISRQKPRHAPRHAPRSAQGVEDLLTGGVRTIMMSCILLEVDKLYIRERGLSKKCHFRTRKISAFHSSFNSFVEREK